VLTGIGYESTIYFMKDTKIYEWKDIKDNFKDKLVLGNGASIAVWDDFHYDSLYDEAHKSGKISDNLEGLFDKYQTRDFEFILKQLRQARIVNRALEIEEKRTLNSYRLLREALIQTIISIHPLYEDVNNCLLKIASFMQPFETIISLNYDLIVYWAMLRGKDEYGQQFKDGFVDECRFRYEYETLLPAYGRAVGTTMVFYPHGNLILATTLDKEKFGDEIKLTRSDEQAHVLNSIISAWSKGNLIPLFVSEGDTEAKLKAIRRSSYL
jgi:hypothetical protein